MVALPPGEPPPLYPQEVELDALLTRAAADVERAAAGGPDADVAFAASGDALARGRA